MNDFLLAPLSDFIQTNKESFYDMGRVNSKPSYRVMEPIHRFDPRADCDAAPPAARPFSLIHSPEDKALFLIDVPFPKTGVVVNRVWNVIAWFSFGYCARRAVLCAVLAGHAEVVEPKGYGFVRLEGQIRRHGFEAHVVAILGRKDSSRSADSPTRASKAMGTMFISGSRAPRVSRYMASYPNL